jgi:mono/diheme cytochrome c family protein
VTVVLAGWLWFGGADSAPGRFAAQALARARLAELHARAAALPAPPTADAKRLVLGFRDYDGHCVACHGAPGVSREDFAHAMDPQPRALADAPPALAPREAFWVVCHGLPMSGMPAWGAHRTDDQVWNIVLFARTLPAMSPQAYQGMRQTYGPAPEPLSMTPDAACLQSK